MRRSPTKWRWPGYGGMLTGVTLRDVSTAESRRLDATGRFIAIGHDPRTELFADQLDLDSDGYIIVQAPTTRTSVPGVFAAGDVVDHTYRHGLSMSAGCSFLLGLAIAHWFADSGG